MLIDNTLIPGLAYMEKVDYLTVKKHFWQIQYQVPWFSRMCALAYPKLCRSLLSCRTHFWPQDALEILTQIIRNTIGVEFQIYKILVKAYANIIVQNLVCDYYMSLWNTSLYITAKTDRALLVWTLGPGLKMLGNRISLRKACMLQMSLFQDNFVFNNPIIVIFV